MDETKRLVYHRNIDNLSAFLMHDRKLVPDELKPQYAAFLACEPDPFKAALLLIPDNHGYAAWVAVRWADDPEVLAERDRYRREVMAPQQPDKMDLAMLVWDMAADPRRATEDRIKAAKLYAEINGFIEKAAPAQTNVQVINPKVIHTVNHGSDADWEANAKTQQAELLSVADSRH